MTSYRLVLFDEGRGLLAAGSLESQPSIYEIRSWNVVNRSIHFSARQLSGNNVPLSLSGEMVPGGMLLVVKEPEWVWQVEMHRESAVLDAARKLREAMNGLLEK